MKFLSVAACAFTSIAFIGLPAQADTNENRNSEIFKSGPYVGGSLGYSYVDGDLNQSVDGKGRFQSGKSYWQQTSLDALNKAFSNPEKSDGYEATIFAGYNFKLGSFILSPEGSVFFGNKEVSSSTGNVVYPCCAPNTAKVESRISTNYGADARLRVGIPFKSFMPYAFAGPSLANMQRSQTFSDTYGFRSHKGQSTQSAAWGYILGGGIEYAASETLSLRLEYKYNKYNLSTRSASGFYIGDEYSTDLYNVSGNVSSSTISLGAAYRF